MLKKHVFKHKNGGICEVYTHKAIEKMRKDKNYTEVKTETTQKITQKTTQEEKQNIKEEK